MIVNADENDENRSKSSRQQEMIRLSDETDGIRCLFQNPHRERWIYGGCSKGRIALIKPKGTKGKHRIIRYFSGHSGAVVSITSVSAANLIISGSHDGMLRGWTDHGHCQFVFRGHNSQVKTVIAVEHSFPASVMSAGLDNKVILWTLPEEREAVENAAVGDEDDEEASSTSTGTSSSVVIPQLVSPKAILPVPAAAICGNNELSHGNALLGLSGNLLMSINTKLFLRQSQDFHNKNTMAIEKKENELKQQAAKMAASAQRMAQKLTHRLGALSSGAEEDEDEEHVGPAIEVDSGDSHDDNILQQVTAIRNKLQIREVAIDKALKARCHTLEKLKHQTCEFSAAAYNTQSFCNIVARFPESVTAVTVDSNTDQMFAVVGDKIRRVPFRHSVSIL